MYSWIPTTEQMLLLSQAQRRYVLARVLLDPPPLGFEWIYYEYGGSSYRRYSLYIKYEEGWHGTEGCVSGWACSLWPETLYLSEQCRAHPQPDLTRQDITQLLLKGTGAE